MRGVLDLARLDLLAEPFRRPPDHQPGDEHGDEDVEDHAVEPRADPAEDHLAEEDVDERHSSAGRRQRIVARRSTDRSTRRVVARRPERACWRSRSGPPCRSCCRRDWPRCWVMFTPESRSTAEPCCSRRQRRRRRARTSTNIAANTAHAWRRASTIRPNMNTCADRDQQDREHLEEVRQPRRVLERDRRVRVVEAAAVRAELLDRLLRGDRAARDRLRARPAACRGRVSVERLRHALPDQDHREHDRERQQDVDDRAVEVAPEVAEPPPSPRRAMPRTIAARTAMPDAGRDEVLHREPGHLA